MKSHALLDFELEAGSMYSTTVYYSRMQWNQQSSLEVQWMRGQLSSSKDKKFSIDESGATGWLW